MLDDEKFYEEYNKTIRYVFFSSPLLLSCPPHPAFKQPQSMFFYCGHTHTHTTDKSPSLTTKFAYYRP